MGLMPKIAVFKKNVARKKEIARIHKCRKHERMQRSTAKKKLLFLENCMNYLIGKNAIGITDEKVTISLRFHSRRNLFYVSRGEEADLGNTKH